MVSSEASAYETPNSVAEKPDELISKHEAVTKVVEDTASCKKNYQGGKRKAPKEENNPRHGAGRAVHGFTIKAE